MGKLSENRKAIIGESIKETGNDEENDVSIATAVMPIVIVSRVIGRTQKDGSVSVLRLGDLLAMCKTSWR
jgi:hypothetical protein